MFQFQKIKELLIGEIGGMEVGARLPSRTDLVRRLQTTRTTLDRAINELIAEGVLSAHKGSGTYVVGLLDGKSERMENWGVILPSTKVDVFPRLLQGIREEAARYGVNLIVCDTESDGDKQERFIKRLIASGAAGFIIVPIVSKNASMSNRLYQALLQSSIPFVFCNREVEGIEAPTVKSTDFYGGYLAPRHLIKHGYRRIAYVATQKYQTSMERYQGYVSALLENGLPVLSRHVYLPITPTPHCHYARALEMLRDLTPPDAFFCFNDSIAEEVYRAVKVAGLSISDDVGIIGYDNTAQAAALSPPLTSMSYQSARIGQKAAQLLWSRIHASNQSPAFEYKIFQPATIVRQSCKQKQEKSS